MRDKECYTCFEKKSLYDFCKERRNIDGYANRCRECNKAYRRNLLHDKIKHLPIFQPVNTANFEVTFY